VVFWGGVTNILELMYEHPAKLLMIHWFIYIAPRKISRWRKVS